MQNDTKYKKSINRLFNQAYYPVVIIFLLLVFTNAATAQLRISGKLTDSTGTAIASATVSLHDKTEGLVLAYAITDKAGAFTIKLDEKNDSNTWLFCYAAGFRQDSMQVTKEMSGLVIKLARVHNVLPPVTVKNRRSFASQKPDTSSFKTEKFTHKQDRTIEDVLKKIPGIEVDPSGKISHNGKAISHFYIDGDDIVNDRYTIATRAIRPEMVDEVQVVQKHNPIKVLESAVASDKTAINLSLKPEARLVIMGNAGGDIGTHHTYKAIVDLMSFKKKYKFINQFKTNNTGQDLAQELTPHNFSDFLKKLELNLPKPMLSTGETGAPDIGKNRYLFNRVGTVTINNSFAAKNEKQIKFNLNYLYDRQNRIASTHSIFTLPTGNISYAEKKEQENRFSNLNAQLSITANKKEYYSNNVFSFQSSNPLGLAEMQLNGLQFSEKYTSKNWNISNEYSLIKKKGNGKIIEFNSYAQYLHTPETLTINPGLNDFMFNKGEGYNQLEQTVQLRGLYLKNDFTYRKVQPFLLQSYKFGAMGQWQQLTSSVLITDSAGALKMPNDSFRNQLLWNQYKLYAKADYDIMAGYSQLSISVPLSLYFINKKNEGGYAGQKFAKLIFSPSLRWKYEIGSEHFITANYQYNATPTGIQEGYFNYILSNYMVLNSWKLPVVTNGAHSASISWNGNKSAKMLAAYFTIGYSTGTNRFVQQALYYNSLQIQDFVPGLNNAVNRNLTVGISKYVFSIHSTISAKMMLRHSEYNQVQQNVPVKFADKQQVFSGKIQSKVGGWLSGSYSVVYATGRSKNLTQADIPEQKTAQTVHQMEINIFPVNNITVRFSEEYYYTSRGSSVVNTSFFSDVQIRYLLPKYKMELGLECVNLMGRQEYTTIAVSGNHTSQNTFPIRPQTILFSMRVRF